MKKNLLVTLADKKYVDAAKQLFSSVYYNSGWDEDYMLMAYNLPKKDIKWFKDRGIIVKDFGHFTKPRIIRDLPVSPLSPTAYLKFYLFKKEFKRWSRIIFLDSDIIVRKPLKHLKKLRGFYAVRDYYTGFRSPLHRQLMEEGVNLPVKWKKIFIKLKKNYDITTKSFNTGVFVFSTDIIKNNSFSKLKKLFLDYYPLAKYYDQPILNLFFYKKWKELPIQYNIEPVFSWRLKHKISPKKIRAIIWHFVGSNNKPWEKNHPFYRYWKESLSKADMINVKKFPNNIISYTPLNIFIHDKVLRLIRISDPREIRSITGHFMYRLLEMKKQLFKQL